MEDIIAGVRAFQRDVYPSYRERFAELAGGQSPRAMVITCSDSRVDPFLFMQAAPGQLFVLRNAGNIVPEHSGFVGGVTATIEFAVVQLKVPNIIVCGHAGCGAVAGLLHPESIRHLPEVTNWLHHSARARAARGSHRRHRRARRDGSCRRRQCDRATGQPPHASLRGRRDGGRHVSAFMVGSTIS